MTTFSLIDTEKTVSITYTTGAIVLSNVVGLIEGSLPVINSTTNFPTLGLLSSVTFSSSNNKVIFTWKNGMIFKVLITDFANSLYNVSCSNDFSAPTNGVGYMPGVADIFVQLVNAHAITDMSITYN